MTETKPEPIMERKPAHNRLKIAVDILSAIFVIYGLIGGRILCHYDPNCLGQLNLRAKMPTEIVLVFLDIIPAIFGGVWLLARYQHVWGKYPLITTLFSRNYRILVVLMAVLFVTLLQIIDSSNASLITSHNLTGK